MKRKIVLHLITRDKFTTGYINFMKTHFTNINHYFVMLNEGFVLELIDYENTIYIDKYMDIVKNEKIAKLLEVSDIIIISGFWGLVRPVAMFSDKILAKTHIHLWGGDFYCFQGEDSVSEKGKELNALRRYVFEKCASLMFLIDGEYEKFYNLTGIKKEYSIAMMPADPKTRMNYLRYMDIANLPQRNYTNILVGNSATKSNCHIEAFDLIKKYIGNSIKVYCPLSYGDGDEYKNYVISRGYEIFGGECFVPIQDYMDLDRYYKFLSGIDIAIFNTYRQQGMGNIQILLGYGKKVYIRKDLSMWNSFIDREYVVFDVETISSKTFDTFSYFGEGSRMNNRQICFREIEEGGLEGWKQFFKTFL